MKYNIKSSTELPEFFDPELVKEGDYDCLPVGTYTAEITDTSVTTPKTGDGRMVNLTYRIINGKYEGRFVWQSIIYMHSSAQAVSIGHKMLKALCTACGVKKILSDVAVFVGHQCLISIVIRKDEKGEYPDKNKVRRILPLKDE